MKLFLEEEGENRLPFDVREVAEQVISASLDYLDCPYEAEVSLLLTNDAEIREMNREYRQIDRATDVLSFPMLEYTVPGRFEDFEEKEDSFDPETGSLLLGDIVISKEHVISQAELYGHSQKREYAFLIAHSMLHLSGFDHLEEEERRIMEEKQRDIMELVKIPR